MKIYEPRVIVALDYKNEKDAMRFVELVDPSLCKLKVGKELFTHTGPNFVSNLIKKGFDVFLDLKFYDIPSTVSKAVAAADDMGVWMTDIHASGGSKMMEEARNTLDKNNSEMLIIAVTVLTSLSRSDLSEVGISFSPEQQVSKLASLAKKSGMDGVVASALVAAELRNSYGDDFILVTPGIRHNLVTTNDQKRIMTPSQAIFSGSNYLVIGRPITQASNPVNALKIVNDEILSAL